MYILEKIKFDIAVRINEALGRKAVRVSDLVFPPNPAMGDLSLPCFNLVKELKKPAVEIAKELAKKLSFGSAGPYLNFFIDKKYLVESIIKEIGKKEEKYGHNESGEKKRIVIEYANQNTHKEVHIGHLRNFAYGDAIKRILTANGYNVIPVSYINDFGIHVAKTLWWVYHSENEYAKGVLKRNAIEDKGCFFGSMYAGSTKKLEEKGEGGKKEVSEIMKQIENRSGKYYKLWKETRKWSIEQFEAIYKELGVKLKHIFYENEFVDEGKKMAADLVKKGLLKESEGAVIADLEKYNLGVLVFLRADGTALYSIADLPLALKKLKKYKAEKSIITVDIRQGLYFKQLFKILELLGHKEEFIHLGYEFVKLPTGMMSSRTGNIITYENLKEETFKKAEEETGKRHAEWSRKKIKETAKKIGIGAMKFEMLKVGREQVITFDINEALRFDGFTAAYLQYTYARIKSITRKAEFSIFNFQFSKKINFNKLREAKEHGLIIKLAKYPEAVVRAGEKYDPSEIAKHLFDLAREFNDYYHSVPVLKAEEETRNARLALIGAVSQVIENGLGLLGLETMEEM